jgi:hypothetical protein
MDILLLWPIAYPLEFLVRSRAHHEMGHALVAMALRL